VGWWRAAVIRARRAVNVSSSARVASRNPNTSRISTRWPLIARTALPVIGEASRRDPHLLADVSPPQPEQRRPRPAGSAPPARRTSTAPRTRAGSRPTCFPRAPNHRQSSVHDSTSSSGDHSRRTRSPSAASKARDPTCHLGTASGAQGQVETVLGHVQLIQTGSAAARLARVAVAPSSRRKGYGRALLTERSRRRRLSGSTPWISTCTRTTSLRCVSTRPLGSRTGARPSCARTGSAHRPHSRAAMIRRVCRSRARPLRWRPFAALFSG
jgi:ribosomal protein S18 acetylase RimI-like enzyme